VTAESRRGPLRGFAASFAEIAHSSAGQLRIAELPFLTKTNVRAAGVARSAASVALGVELPSVPNTVATAGERAALWLGPDEWLVVGGPPPAAAPPGCGLVDVSAQYITISLGGPAAFEVLAHGCALDLPPAGTRWCAQTALARADVTLWGADVDEIRILVRCSFARYLATWILDASVEHTA
jgi:sarcosine oxidase subunit gamma